MTIYKKIALIYTDLPEERLRIDYTKHITRGDFDIARHGYRKSIARTLEKNHKERLHREWWHVRDSSQVARTTATTICDKISISDSPSGNVCGQDLPRQQ